MLRWIGAVTLGFVVAAAGAWAGEVPVPEDYRQSGYRARAGPCARATSQAAASATAPPVPAPRSMRASIDTDMSNDPNCQQQNTGARLQMDARSKPPDTDMNAPRPVLGLCTLPSNRQGWTSRRWRQC